MPKEFLDCVKRGGKVRTVKPRPDVYIHVCYPKGGGKPVRGEVRHIKEKESRISKVIKERVK